MCSCKTLMRLDDRWLLVVMVWASQSRAANLAGAACLEEPIGCGGGYQTRKAADQWQRKALCS